jgi:Lrp/AsnC family transcriptional regulator, regulator for asnA, asnC and gidA
MAVARTSPCPLRIKPPGARGNRAIAGSRRVKHLSRPGNSAINAGVNEALDDVNKQIIEHLQRDGRMSYATLAKTIGLSEAAVRQRVQRLLDGGLMQIVAVTDPLTLGFARQAMVGLKVNGDLRKIADKIAAIPEVDYVVICAGGFDLLVELVCTDDEHLLDLLNEKVRAVEGVTFTETFMYLKLAKQTYAWGTR